ncbi:MAG: alpha/beta hydrolase domain-containing protein [Spongiibacteraceae bacterium]
MSHRNRCSYPAIKRFISIFIFFAGLTNIIISNETHAASAVPTPVVSLPPNVGTVFNTSPKDLTKYGLEEKEFFFEGSTAVGTYKSRMIVRKPVNPRRFNGTVIVEWMNASSGNDIDVEFLSLLPLLAERGYAYVGVTSQQVTVNFLKARYPDRYSTLTMSDTPTQAAANEVFAQAGKALLDNDGQIDPLGGLHAQRLIAIGQSQSSGRLITFINSVHGISLEPIYAGFIPHAGGAAPSRFPVPILQLNSENEAPNFYAYRNVADSLYRYWEVPGTAHQPLESNDYAHDLLRLVRGSFPDCPFPYEGPGGPAPIDPVMRAAVVHVDAWIRHGRVPPQAPLIDMTPSPTNPNVGVIQRDQYGNALGGIRLPQQEVPTGRNTPSYACFITTPIGQIQLATFPQWDAFDGGADPAVDPTDTVNATEPASAKAVYRNHGNYVMRFARATKAVENQGFILKSDAIRMLIEAANSDIAK